MCFPLLYIFLLLWINLRSWEGGPTAVVNFWATRIVTFRWPPLIDVEVHHDERPKSWCERPGAWFGRPESWCERPESAVRGRCANSHSESTEVATMNGSYDGEWKLRRWVDVIGFAFEETAFGEGERVEVVFDEEERSFEIRVFFNFYCQWPSWVGFDPIRRSRPIRPLFGPNFFF